MFIITAVHEYKEGRKVIRKHRLLNEVHKTLESAKKEAAYELRRESVVEVCILEATSVLFGQKAEPTWTEVK